MADYYTQFSVAVRVSGREEEVRNWIDNFYELRDEKEADENFDEYHENWEGVEIELDLHDGAWFHSKNDNGNTTAAAFQIQRFMQDFNLAGGVFMTYGSWCSKDRVNEASGGSCVITKDEVIWTDTHTILREAAEAGVEIIN